jgi:hypothetical protein
LYASPGPGTQRMPDVIVQKVGKRKLASWSRLLDSSLQSLLFFSQASKNMPTQEMHLIHIAEIGVTWQQYSMQE